MELKLYFVPNAFKHGITEDEIWEVFLNGDIMPVIVKYQKTEPDIIYNAYGLTANGRYLEIGYVKKDVSNYRIIHAMDMRDATRKRFKKIRRL